MDDWFEREETKASLKRLQEKMEERKRRTMAEPREWPPADALQEKAQAFGLTYAISCHVVPMVGPIWCGYVHVPVDHPDANYHYDEVKGVDVHGGLTFSTRAVDGGMWFGFDCGHHQDKGKWDLDSVRRETLDMAGQFALKIAEQKPTKPRRKVK